MDGAEPNVLDLPGERAYYNPNVCGDRTYGTNGVLWRNIDGAGGIQAYVAHCDVARVGGQRLTANMVIDSSEDWCYGTGDCDDGVLGVGAKSDVWSVITHEWGHMTGFDGPFANGHFDPDSSICEETPQAAQTMCPYYDPGSERWRTLNSHDKHTYQSAY